MAQTKTIQLLRSQSLYQDVQAAKTAVTGMTGQDGEIRLARYIAGTQEVGNETVNKIQSLICIYHNATGITPAGWTFIEDVSNNPDSPAALLEEINQVETSVGLETDGSWDGYASGSEIVGEQDTITGTIDAIINYIKGLDKSADAQNGQVVTTVTQANGAVTETKANVKDLQLGGYSKDSNATGAIGSTDTVNTALSKLENAIAENTVSSNDKTVTIDTTGTTTDLSVNIDGTTIVKSNAGVLSADLTVAKLNASEVTALSDANVKEAYKLIYATDANRTAIGDVVKIYKDSALQNVYMGHIDDTLSGQDATTHESSSSTVVPGTGDDALCFVYQLANGNYKLESVNVQAFLKETEFKDGLTVDTSNHTVSVKVGNGLELGTAATDGNKPVQVKIDSTSSDAENFLSVGANGVKISGVQDAIDTAIEALDVTDAAVAGQYVSAVNETDGKVSMTRANVADAVLTGYSKGSSAPANTDVAATDDVKTAIAKLEWQVDAANAGVEALDATVNSTGGTNVALQVVEQDGVITTVTVTTDNTINSTDLTTAIEALDADLNATGTAAHSGTFVMSGVTEVDGVITSVDSVEVEAAGAAAAAKTTIDAYTVNSKAISTNPVLNGSDIALTGYAKGADGTAVSASDSVNVAIGKLENQVDAAKAAATAAHTAVKHATGNTHVTVSASQPDSTTGKVTYTVNETNIADADDLTAEIAARKAVDGQSGDTYTANSGANYISGATSLNNADVLLDGQVKTNADDILKNKISAADNSVTVTETNSTATGTTVGVKFAPSSLSNANSMITVESNGITLSNVWDCGTF